MMLISFGLTAYISRTERIQNTVWIVVWFIITISRCLFLLARMGWGEKTPLKGLCHTHMSTHTHTHVIIHLSHFVYQCITSLVCACVSRFFFEFLNLPRTRGEYKSKQAKAQASMRTSKQGNLVAAVAAAAVENMCNDTNIAKSKTSKHHRRRRF